MTLASAFQERFDRYLSSASNKATNSRPMGKATAPTMAPKGIDRMKKNGEPSASPSGVSQARTNTNKRNASGPPTAPSKQPVKQPPSHEVSGCFSSDSSGASIRRVMLLLAAAASSPRQIAVKYSFSVCDTSRRPHFFSLRRHALKSRNRSNSCSRCISNSFNARKRRSSASDTFSSKPNCSAKRA